MINYALNVRNYVSGMIQGNWIFIKYIYICIFYSSKNYSFVVTYTRNGKVDTRMCIIRIDSLCDVNVESTSLECFIFFIAFANTLSTNVNDASKAHFERVCTIFSCAFFKRGKLCFAIPLINN